MAISASVDLCASDRLAQQQRVQACQRVLHAPDWEQRLAPLAKHLADHGLVRSRGYDGAFARHIDPHMLREALGVMLDEQWEDAYLIVQLLIEERDPALGAAAPRRGPPPPRQQSPGRTPLAPPRDPSRALMHKKG